MILYQYYTSRNKVSIWNLIPKQTVLLYVVGDCESCNPEIKKSSLERIFKNIFLSTINPNLDKELIDLLSPDKSGDAVSIHIKSKDDFDAVFYFSKGQAKKFETTLNSLKADRRFKFLTRELNGIEIQELFFSEKKFSCVFLDGIWVGSFTAFLIEDVIRTFTSDNEQTFAMDISKVLSLPKIEGDLGDIYIHLENLIDWINVFPERQLLLTRIGLGSLLDIKQTENSLTLNGFSVTRDTADESLLSYFKNQLPVQFIQKQYISNRAVFVVNYGISNGDLLFEGLSSSGKRNGLDSLSKIAKVNFERLFSSFGNEMSLCFLESKNQSFSKVILFETKSTNDWLRAFDQLSKSLEREDTVFYEKYSTYEIREIEIDNLPGKLFGPLTSGFSQTYYTHSGNTIILSERLEEIKQCIDDIDNEEVWGKSVEFNKFLESTLLESNLSVYINTPLVLNLMSDKLNPRWKSFLEKNQVLLKSLDLGAVQFSHLNNNFYTNLIWTHSKEAILEERHQSQKSNPFVVTLGSSIISEPFVLRSNVTKKDEILVQDSLFVLHYFSSDGKALWKVPLGEPIVGEVSQVDIFKNGKLQFFFATNKKLHVVDRLGNYVAPFPKEVNVKDIEFISTVDYDNSKKYRFLLAERSGKLWIFDKDVQNLDGWKPKNIENGLFTNARHHRIRGKDYLMAIRQDGWAYLMNRRGEDIKGFPLNLDARPDGDYYVEIGNSIATTYFTCISKDGFRIKFCLEGKLLSRETLVKPTFETQFSLIVDQQRKSYLIKLQDAKKLTLLNEEGRELLSNKFIGKNQVDVQYYDFGAGKVYISIIDITQELIYIYDGKGGLITPTPIGGRFIKLRPTEGKFPRCFVVERNVLTIQ